MKILLFIVVGGLTLLVLLRLLAGRAKRGMEERLQALKASGHPGRVSEILALEPHLAVCEMSNHVFFVRMEEGGLEGLTAAERTFRLVDEVLMEVHNGGFEQYFYNLGEHAQAAVVALRELGAPRDAEILEEALTVLGPQGLLADPEARREQMAGLEPPARTAWEALSARFCDETQAASRQMDFVREHAAEFLDA